METGDQSIRLVGVSPSGISSGAEKVLLRVLGAAIARQWSASCASPDGPLAVALDELGAGRVRLPDLKLPRGPLPVGAGLLVLRNVLAARTLRRACRGADVIVANSLLTLPALALARPRSPVVMLVHDVIQRPSWRWILRRCRRVVTLAIAVSSAAAAPLERAGLTVTVVRNGTPWPVRPAADEPPHPPVVGCAALLTPWKGQDVLLEAVARLSRTDIEVELAGGRLPKDDAYADALEERIRRPDLAGRARLLGPLDDAPQRMRRWTVLVVPSVDPEAGGPLVLLEAMSLGVPVVSTDHGAPSEVLGEAGLLVPPRDPGALASAIERLVEDDAVWRRCHEAGPRQVAAGLTLEHQLDAIMGVLGEVAGRGGRSRCRALAPTAAIVAWGLMLEDFLTPNGLSLDEFCTEFTGSWMFGYAEALRSAGVRPVIVAFSGVIDGVVRRVHGATGTDLCLIPVPRQYRALRRRMSSPYGRSATETFDRPRTLGTAALWPLLFVAKELAPYLTTPPRTVARELRREDCKALICQEYEFPRFDVCAALGRIEHLVVYASFQGGDYQRWHLERLTRPLAMRLASGVIIASEAEAERVRSLYGRVEVARIPNPIDLRVWKPHDRLAARKLLDIAPDARVVGWHGRMDIRKKGLDTLIEAWSRVSAEASDRARVLLLIGTGQDSTEIRRVLGARSLTNVVWVDRYLHDPAEMARLLSAADVYAFPSRYEGFPVAPIEAMACGLPIVSADVSGIRDVLTGGAEPSGVIVPRDAPEQLAAELSRLLANPELSEALGRRARDRAMDFGVEAVGLQLRRLLFAEQSQEGMSLRLDEVEQC